MPYDSFLLDPILLLLTGLCAARLIAALPPRWHARALRTLFAVTLAIYWITSVSLYFDLEWTRWLWQMCGATSGRDWMINSGVFHVDIQHIGWGTHLVGIAIFLTYPAWLALGLVLAWPRPTQASLGPARWHGQSGRTEVWYATLHDEASGAALWVHGETVARADGATAHGWAAFFPRDGAPIWSRFGPVPAQVAADPRRWFEAAGCVFDAHRLHGETPRIAWSLDWRDAAKPLWPFPAWLWHSELLPGCMVVLAPTAQFSGLVRVDGEEQPWTHARGGISRIFGHGNALRWVWLHADLGQGEVLEIVAAVSRRPGLSKLAPLAFVRLRSGGFDWPPRPLQAALRGFEVSIEGQRWQVRGAVGDRRLEVEVSLPAEATVAIGYVDPDGATATCLNSEQADTRVQSLRRRGGAWHVEKTWNLAGTAHAEIGVRP